MQQLKRNGHIANRVKEMTRAGVSVRDIFGAIQNYADALKQNLVYNNL